jgi:maltose/glucose PTS system EIICB component
MVKIFIISERTENMMPMFSDASSGAWFEKAQRFGKSFMSPVAVLPAARRACVRGSKVAARSMKRH